MLKHFLSRFKETEVDVLAQKSLYSHAWWQLSDKRGKVHTFMLSFRPVWMEKEWRKHLADDYRLDYKAATIPERLYLLVWSIPWQRKHVYLPVSKREGLWKELVIQSLSCRYLNWLSVKPKVSLSSANEHNLSSKMHHVIC